MSFRHRQFGLSLVELMIAITLGLILMIGVMQMFLSSKVVFATQQGISRIQETGRLAIEFLSRDIRMAAYYGCYRPSVVAGSELKYSNMVISGLHGNFSEGIRGFDSDQSLPVSKAQALGGSIQLLPSTHTANIIVIRSASETGIPINNLNTETQIRAYSPSSIENNCINNICVNSAAVVNNCSSAAVMRVTALAKAGTDVTITHNGTWNPLTVPSEAFLSGEVMPLNTTVYFIARGVSGVPTLWQKTNADAAVELLEGVEHMRITYATSDNINYRLASQLSADDWPKVNSVRLELVIRSIDNNVLEDTQPYQFAGVTVTPVDVGGIKDRYMRQVFTATIAIRSRATNIQ
ncbi:type 4 fimbrial biogenesis protein PilW [Cellvibrio japonicus Ueda107]|uniref:Type 4 fimbrial biogenesis protein PilW n=2 Tax=Cellvibrio japonicus TaxID=155077 RepID=B3PE09_CELJU|nr:type 4 fimbrial biogenesis protein PilW [Cellvibrio japonicus Ueda107]